MATYRTPFAPFIGREEFLRISGDVVLADVRWYLDGRSGRDEYESVHAPGAIYIELEEWLAGPASPAVGRHPLPSPEVFAEGMSAHGIGDDTVVIAYDDAGGVIAARLVWMLRVTGHSAAVLDGGLSVFGDTKSGPSPARHRAAFTPTPWPRERLATIDEASDPSRLVIDARNRDRYEGAPDQVDPRFGHIPGAMSVPCRENIEGQILRDSDVVRQIFEAAGVTPGTDVISYCGSGVTACHNLLTMEWVGLGTKRLFPGSWSQYAHDLNRPVATHSE